MQAAGSLGGLLLRSPLLRSPLLRSPLGGFAATARDVEEHLLQRLAAVAGQKARRRVVILDAAALHDDDPVAQPLDLGHVVGGEQHGRATLGPVALKPAAYPVS